MSRILKNSRLLHLYLGIFTAPAIIFFSITGALQTFSLHETTRGSDYKPPKIISELSQLHKKQTLVVPAKKPQPPAQAADKPQRQAPGRKFRDSGRISTKPRSPPHVPPNPRPPKRRTFSP